MRETDVIVSLLTPMFIYIYIYIYMKLVKNEIEQKFELIEGDAIRYYDECLIKNN